MHALIQKIHRDTVPAPEDVQAQSGKLDTGKPSFRTALCWCYWWSRLERGICRI